MTPKPQDVFQLTIGSRYHIRSMESRDRTLESTGVFKGVVTLGSVDAIVLALDGDGDEANRTRVIPSHVILALDVIEAAAEEATPSDDDHMHYT